MLVGSMLANDFKGFDQGTVSRFIVKYVAENGKNHTTIGSALLGIEPNVSNIPPRR